MKTDQSKLEPCPFCGEPASGHAIEPHAHGFVFNGVKMPDHPGSYVIEGNCQCGSGLIRDTEAEAVEAWNRRTPKHPVSVEVSDALDRMDALLDPERRLLAVDGDSATAHGSRADMALIRGAILALAGGERKEASKPDPVAVMTTQGLKFYSAEVAKSLHVGTQFYTEPVKEASKPVADEREVFTAWARDQGYQSDELDRCKIGVVSPEFYNLNTENAYKAFAAGRAALASHHPSNAEPSAEQPTCHWHPDGTGDWTTGCGLTHTMHGTPWKKGMHFCCGCGKHLMEHSHAQTKEAGR